MMFKLIDKKNDAQYDVHILLLFLSSLIRAVNVSKYDISIETVL